MAFREMIYDYKKRTNMRQHPIFKSIVSKYSLKIEQTGNLKYLLRQAHENAVIKNKDAVVKMNDWVNFYFSSGLKRKTAPESSQTKQYYGRSEEDLMELTNQFYNILTHNGFRLTLQAAANIIYIMVIDMPYDEYMRCFNVIFQLRNKYPDMEFTMTPPLDMENYNVDIIVKKGKIISGITVLPMEKHGTNIESYYKQSHEIFHMILECGVVFVYAEVNGRTLGLPEFH